MLISARMLFVCLFGLLDLFELSVACFGPGLKRLRTFHVGGTSYSKVAFALWRENAIVQFPLGVLTSPHNVAQESAL